MTVIIEGSRPAFRITDNKPGSGEPPDAISTMVFRTSGGRIGLPRVVSDRRTGGRGGKRMGRKKSHGAPVVEVDQRKKPSERRTPVFAPYENSVSLAEGYSICRSKAPSTASLSRGSEQLNEKQISGDPSSHQSKWQGRDAHL